MTDQEEFEKWFLSNLPESSMPMMDYVIRKGYSEKAWQACAERKNAVIERQDKELEALREYCAVMISTQGKFFAKHYKLIDENGNPTQLLTGEK